MPTPDVPLGLFLTDEELHEFFDGLEMKGPSHAKLDLDLRQRLGKLTSGHIGAIMDMEKWISTSIVCTQVFPDHIF